MSTARSRKTRKLGLGLASTSMTPEEFDRIRDVDPRYVYEIIRGVLVVSRFPSPAERGPNEKLGFLLLAYQAGHPEGRALDETLPEQFLRTPDSRRRADRLIWAGLGRVPDLEEDVPTVAVEFVSATRRDRLRDYEEKRAEYLALGVREYWVIDRFRRQMTVYRAGEPEVVVPSDGLYRTPLLPGFELPIAALLAEADKWRKRKPG